MRTVRVQPEHHRHPRLTRTGDGQLHPVADRCVLDDGHAPDVAGFHVLCQQHLPGFEVHDVGNAVLGDLERLVMRAVLLGLLRHQADVGDGAHRRRVELAVRLTEVDDLLVDAGERGLGFTALVSFFRPSAPYILPPSADHRGHRGVHDDVTGRMEVRDPLGRIHHGQLGTVLMAGVQVVDDLVALRRRQRLDLAVEIDQPVVDVHTEFVEQFLVLGERRPCRKPSLRVRRRSGAPTFIIVALTCSENITPVSYASSSALRRTRTALSCS